MDAPAERERKPRTLEEAALRKPAAPPRAGQNDNEPMAVGANACARGATASSPSRQMLRVWHQAESFRSSNGLQA